MKIQLHILILFFSVQIFAQVPGYQGKRFFAEIGGSFFFNHSYPTAQNKGPASFPFYNHTGHFTLRDRYHLTLYYTVSRKSVLHLGYDYQVSGLNIEHETTAITANGLDLHQLFYQVHCHDVNIGLNVFNRKKINLAPLGFYWDYSLRILYNKCILRDQMVKYADGRNDLRPYADQLLPIDLNTNIFILGIGVKFGYRYIFANRITLNLGLETTVLPQALIAIPGAPNPITGNSNSNLDALEYHTMMTAQLRYLLNLNIGIGFLIY